MESLMLQMTQVQKVYRTELIETRALRDLSLTIKKGEFVAVTGSSGSGKTTFLNIAGLLETIDQGTYLLNGEDVSQLSDNERSIYRNEKIGFIFQSFNLIPDLNLFENVDEYGENKTLSIIAILGDGQYKESMVVDKKLQFIVTILNILEL